jgi:hypothetical protein
MPNPLVDGYGIRPVDRRTKTDMDVSGIYRNEFDTDACECSCTMELNQDEAAFFEAFERDMLAHGATWFDMPLWVGGQIETHRVRFREHPQSSISGLYTMYSWSFDVRERHLIDECLMQDLINWWPFDIRTGYQKLCRLLDSAGGCTNIPTEVYDG